MAVNTNITALAAGSDITVANNVKVWSRVIDTAVHNLANGAHFEVFSVPAGTLVINGIAEVLTADSGGGAFTVGYGGTGHELVNSTNVNVTGKAVLDHTGVFFSAADTIDLAAAAANLTTAKIRITLLTLDIDALPSRGATGTA